MTAKEFVIDYVENHPDNRDDNGKPYYEDLSEFFHDMGGECGWTEVTSSSRWWDNLFAVQKINGKLVGYGWASTTGDTSINDVGWEFDEDSICFVEPYEETITRYREIK